MEIMSNTPPPRSSLEICCERTGGSGRVDGETEIDEEIVEEMPPEKSSRRADVFLSVNCSLGVPGC